MRTPDAKHVLNAVLKSNEFANAGQAEALLVFLFQHPGSSSLDARTRGVKKTVFPKSENINLSAKIIDLNKRLDRYFAGAGRQFTHRLRVITPRYPSIFERGRLYEVALVENVPDAENVIDAFWAPYVLPEGHSPVVIGYGVPLFVANAGHDFFTRDVTVNRRHQLKTGERGSYAFVTDGEASCAIALTRLLTVRGVEVHAQKYDCESTMAELMRAWSNANVILLGTTRANGVLQAYQEDRFPFFANDNGVFRYDGSDEFRDVAIGEKLRTHVLVTRRGGAHDQTSWITSIASTSGRAIEGIGEILTVRKELERIIGPEGPPFSSKRWPLEFQLLFEVEVLSWNAVVGKIRLKAVEEV